MTEERAASRVHCTRVTHHFPTVISAPCGAPQLLHVIQRERQLIICCHSEGAGGDRRIPRMVCTGNDPASQTLLSFSRSARESPRWLRRGNDDVLPCPCVGDSTGYWRTPLNDGEFESPRPRSGALPLNGGLRRRKVRSTPLPPCGESYVRSLAPPFRTRSASLGSRPRRGNLREDDGGGRDPPASAVSASTVTHVSSPIKPLHLTQI